MADKKSISRLSELLSSSELELISAKGGNLIKTVGLESIRDVVFDVLTGRNIRNSTENLTRRRIAMLS
ncbi:hypothetical protein FBR01_12705 [Anaerolineae bacterium CFX8]|nr:hypothetical protein [Anaerolineae bacterium CFX8]